MNSSTSQPEYRLESGHFYPTHPKSELFPYHPVRNSQHRHLSLLSSCAATRFPRPRPRAVISIIDQVNSYTHTVDRFTVLAAPNDLQATQPRPRPQQVPSSPPNTSSSSSATSTHLPTVGIPKHVATLRTEARGQSKLVRLKSDDDNDEVWE
jgi:hypothetical protein